MIRPFRFWCNKILPLVYDDSLSYYELLAKVVDYLNKVIDTTNANTDYISTLAGMITSFIESPELKEIIEAKLDEMAEDGTLDAMLNQPKMFVPNDESINDYKTGTLRKVADWILHLNNSQCYSLKSGQAPPAIKYVGKYGESTKIWQCLLGSDGVYHGDFVYDETIGGLPVVYMNCVGFVNMVTRGRGYMESPNYLATSGLVNVNDANRLKDTCLEVGNCYENSWTIDFLNWLHSYGMFYVMEKSGCAPRNFCHNGVLNDKVFANMETGDILFAARDSNENYRNLHHCMYYIKDLKDLNDANEDLPVTFKAYDFSQHDNYPNDGEWGYIAHCSWGLTEHGFSENSTNDVIRIESLKHFILDDIGRHPSYYPFDYYASKPYSNTLNSSKARKIMTGITTDINNVMFGHRNSVRFPFTNVFRPTENKWYQHDVAIEGSYVDSGDTYSTTNLNEFVGVISWTSAAITAGKILNTPDNSHAGTAISYGVKGTHGAQIALLGNGQIAWRKKLSGGGWRAWAFYPASQDLEPEP